MSRPPSPVHGADQPSAQLAATDSSSAGVMTPVAIAQSGLPLKCPHRAAAIGSPVCGNFNSAGVKSAAGIAQLVLPLECPYRAAATGSPVRGNLNFAGGMPAAATVQHEMPLSHPHRAAAFGSPVCGGVDARCVGDASSSHTCGELDSVCNGHSLSGADQTEMSAFLARAQVSLDSTIQVHRRLVELHASTITDSLREALTRHGLEPPTSSPSCRVDGARTTYLIDRDKQRVFSELIRHGGLQLPEFVRLLRGETRADPRPNKALAIPTTHPGWSSYRYKSQWADIVEHGVRPEWKDQFPEQTSPPPNHGSAQRAMNIIVKNLRAGQDSDRYLILDMSLLSLLRGVTCSPFGAVQKGDVDLSVDARIIHDLSFPVGTSVNDNTHVDGSVEITYDGAVALANRVVDVAMAFPGRQRMMTGDVNGAFRHIPIAAKEVGRFAGTVPELGILIVDLCCPFGWSQSPGSYWVAGAAINHLYATSAPNWARQPRCFRDFFDAKAWCDDHTCIEPDLGSRLEEANIALRSSMVSILGANACNEKKFTTWFQRGRALGLDWDLKKLIVSMPPEKIGKALSRIRAIAGGETTTRTQLNKLMGSLRHVVTCIRPAASFVQRLAGLARSTPRFGSVPISAAVRDDLRWFLLILLTGRLNQVPLTRFTLRHEPDFEVHMDASDRGVCALLPARREFIQVEFAAHERRLIQEFNSTGANDFGINVRELMSAVFAAIAWGHHWQCADRPAFIHVRFWIDNQSAVSWTNRRSSRNAFAQLMLRILSLLEVRHGFYCSASHIAGSANTMADAGSRVWQSPDLALTFADLSSMWTQVQIPPDSRNLSLLWERYSGQGL
jgi:hypothetical protein